MPYALSQLTGAYQSTPAFLDTKHRKESMADAEAYLARLAAFARQVNDDTGRAGERGFEGDWGTRGTRIVDGPLAAALDGQIAVLAQPVFNALSRYDETEADRYSLETVDLPDALASALVKTAEYRNPRPHPLQEAIFYTHPSVERRVRMAMEWKAAEGGG